MNVSNDFWGELDAYTMMIDKGVQKLRFRSMEEVAQKYSHHESFYGWYFPNEAQLQPYFIDECVKYVNDCADFAQRLTPNCVNLIAPYFIKEARFDDYFVRQFYFEDGDGGNLLPADFNKRIIRQMENISPFVDKILCYQYIGIMNKPGTDIIAGHPDSLRLYEQYSAWYNQYKNKK